MKNTLYILLLLSILPWQTISAKTAQPSQCENQFVSATLPTVSSARANQMITSLCFNGFSVGYSHRLRTPIWSASYLTRERLRGAYDLERHNQFHEETQLPRSSRVTLDEMRVYNYDRGHLSPNYDMGTIEQQYDSFSLANVVLQHREHNRKLWSNIEKLTRHQVYRYGDAYVVTGVAFLEGKDVARTGILIPSHLFKAVYVPELGQAGVYWSKNDDSQHLEVISLEQLQQKTDLDVMPSLAESLQKTALHLPTDLSDPQADVNLSQAVEAHKPLWSQIKQFFSELWQMIKNLLI